MAATATTLPLTTPIQTASMSHCLGANPESSSLNVMRADSASKGNLVCSGRLSRQSNLRAPDRSSMHAGAIVDMGDSPRTFVQNIKR
jgi:hypothetical protein